VEWPPHTFKGPTDPIVICILGRNPFGHTLEETVRGKSVEGRPLVVREIVDLRHRNCQILFVSASERARWTSIFDETGPAGVLTVGDTPGFASSGGIVNFRIEGDRIRIRINVEAADRANLRISSKLLSLAEIVKRPSP